MTQFFTELAAGKFGDARWFPLFVASERRRHLKNAIYGSGKEKEVGQRIMSNI